MTKNLPLFLALLLAGCASAGRQPSSDSLTKKDNSALLMDYYKGVAKNIKPRNKTKNVFALAKSRGEDCKDHEWGGKSCIGSICEMGTYGCQFESELRKVADLCRNDMDETCISHTCKTGAFQCQFESELTKATNLCENANGRCVKTVCEMNTFQCQFESELRKAADLCERGVHSNCVKDTCAMGTFSCQFESELKKAIEMCK